MAEKKEKKQPVAAVREENRKENNFREIVRTLGISARGRVFQGNVIRKFHKRITIEFERTVKLQKFERFMKKRTRIHARLPDEFADQINMGDLIRVQECRPLSKLIHFIVVEKVRDADSENNNSKDKEKEILEELK
ncbi:30S ribosomal protein S17 [Candidatus Pacearchaeota archaeon]|nr:30S ribosomal protein S17P [uncultured archaeon]MBS3077473.1 30S ribosomal protein S17 [Candidatus Pacearchaeota archaeon]